MYTYYLKKEFDYLVSGGGTDEVTLFEKLIEAIENSKKFFSIAEEIQSSSLHGPSSFTRFNIPSVVSTTNEERICELADVLFIVYSEKKNQGIYSLTQFKREYVQKRINRNKFYVDLIQYSLIKYRPIVNSSKYNMLNNNLLLLNNASRASITNYAVFYDDILGININYYHPEYLKVNNIPKSTQFKKIRRVTEFIGKYASINNQNETEGESGFINFFKSLLSFKIGEYINLLDSFTIKQLFDIGPESFKNYINNNNYISSNDFDNFKVVGDNNIAIIYFNIDINEKSYFKSFFEIDDFFETKRPLLDI